MREYKKPVIETEELEIEDIIAASGDFGDTSPTDTVIDWSEIFS